MDVILFEHIYLTINEGNVATTVLLIKKSTLLNARDIKITINKKTILDVLDCEIPKLTSFAILYYIFIKLFSKTI